MEGRDAKRLLRSEEGGELLFAPLAKRVWYGNRTDFATSRDKRHAYSHRTEFDFTPPLIISPYARPPLNCFHPVQKMGPSPHGALLSPGESSLTHKHGVTTSYVGVMTRGCVT